MLRTKLPWVFVALAVASPPLLWILRESIQQWFETGYERHDDTLAGIIWFFLAVTVSLVFVVLALATWASKSRRDAVLRRLGLLAFGYLSLVVGALSLTYLNLLVKEWGLRPFVLEWGPGGVMIAIGLFAIREWWRSRRRVPDSKAIA